jgi:hypothetical protein
MKLQRRSARLRERPSPGPVAFANGNVAASFRLDFVSSRAPFGEPNLDRYSESPNCRLRVQRLDDGIKAARRIDGAVAMKRSGFRRKQVGRRNDGGERQQLCDVRHKTFPCGARASRQPPEPSGH